MPAQSAGSPDAGYASFPANWVIDTRSDTFEFIVTELLSVGMQTTNVPLDKNRHDKSKTRGLLGIRVAPALHIQYPIPRIHSNRVICVWRGTVYSWLAVLF